jgi:DNA polymerase-3 subunit alpha
MIPANDAHYIEKGQLKYWNFMSATRIRQTKQEHIPITNDDFYIKSKDDIYERTVELCDSKEEANKIIYEGFSKLHELLSFQWKDRKVKKIKYENDSDNLYKLLSQKLINYFGDIKSIPVEYKQQMRKEFDTLVYTGNASYSLLVYDLLEWCRNKGIPTPVGRGSLPSMLTSFMLGISQFDPMKYGLISERALSKERISEVDADLDFSKENVERIKNEYLYTKFGKNKVVNIVNYGEYKMSSTIRAVMKYLSIPVDKQNYVNKAIKNKFVEFKNESEDDGDDTIEPSLKNIMLHDEFRQIFYDNGISNFNEIMEYSQVIEGAFSNISIHASGLLISLDNIYENYGTIRVGDTICSAYDMNSLKYMGALKLDLLSVNTCAKIEKTLQLYNQLKGV